MAEVKVGQKYKPSDWWVSSSLPEHVKITEVHEESDTVCYVPGIYGATGSDEGISTWEDRWILVEDVPQTVAVEDNQLSPNEDMVNHPPHYSSDPSGVECIQITRHRNFNIGNAIKYLWRAGLKKSEGRSVQEKQVEDLKKAVFYIQDEIKRLES